VGPKSRLDIFEEKKYLLPLLAIKMWIAQFIVVTIPD
jgi:hypothetical protein